MSMASVTSHVASPFPPAALSTAGATVRYPSQGFCLSLPSGRSHVLPTASDPDALEPLSLSRGLGAARRSSLGPGRSVTPRRKGAKKEGMAPSVVACLAASVPGIVSAPSQDDKPDTCPAEFVTFANELADVAREIVPKYFRQPIPIDLKADESPVTIADREVERALRSLITSRFPQHAILGEEEGLLEREGEDGSEVPEYMWILDPIDGTASFITGKPLFGVLIALLKSGVPVLGVLDQPILRERWVGVRGQQTFLNGAPVSSRHQCKALRDAYVYTTSPHLFPCERSRAAFSSLREASKRINYGCDCYAFGLLALGFVDIALEFGLKPWDYAALVPIVEGAGGRMTDWCGRPLHLLSLDSSTWPNHVLACGSAPLHESALKALAWSD